MLHSYISAFKIHIKIKSVFLKRQFCQTMVLAHICEWQTTQYNQLCILQ